MKDSTRATVRTVIQVMVGLAVAVPVVVDQLGLSPTLRWVGVALAVSAAVTRVMQIPEVDALLTSWGIGTTQGKHVAGPDDGRVAVLVVAAAAAVGVLVLASATAAAAAQARRGGVVLPHVDTARDCGDELLVLFTVERLAGRRLAAVPDDGRERLEVLDVSGRSGPDGKWTPVPAAAGDGVLRWPGLAQGQTQGGHYGQVRVIRTDRAGITSAPYPIVSGCAA